MGPGVVALGRCAALTSECHIAGVCTRDEAEGLAEVVGGALEESLEIGLLLSKSWSPFLEPETAEEWDLGLLAPDEASWLKATVVGSRDRPLRLTGFGDAFPPAPPLVGLALRVVPRGTFGVVLRY